MKRNPFDRYSRDALFLYRAVAGLVQDRFLSLAKITDYQLRAEQFWRWHASELARQTAEGGEIGQDAAQSLQRFEARGYPPDPEEIHSTFESEMDQIRNETPQLIAWARTTYPGFDTQPITTFQLVIGRAFAALPRSVELVAVEAAYAEIRLCIDTLMAMVEYTATACTIAPEDAKNTPPVIEKIERKEAVILRGRHERPIVLGKEQEKVLTVAQYNVVSALMQAGEIGLSTDKLVETSGHGGAVNVLRRLARSSGEWGSAIGLAGSPGNHFRIRQSDGQ